MKRYVLIAGVNGAGKSTLYQSIDELKELKRINTDEILQYIEKDSSYRKLTFCPSGLSI